MKHAFPTRRSSDLRNSEGPMPNPPTYPPDKPRAIAQQLFQCADDNWLQIMDPTRQFDYATMPKMWDVMAEADVDLETEAGQQDAFRRRPLEADRKRTRLNSSH